MAQVRGFEGSGFWEKTASHGEQGFGLIIDEDDRLGSDELCEKWRCLIDKICVFQIFGHGEMTLDVSRL